MLLLLGWKRRKGRGRLIVISNDCIGKLCIFIDALIEVVVLIVYERNDRGSQHFLFLRLPGVIIVSLYSSHTDFFERTFLHTLDQLPLHF
jgi:hypothetical protein